MTPETLGLARQTLDIVPLVMRTIAAQVRRGGSSLAPSHFRLLDMLAHCPCNLSELARRQGVSLPTISDSITVLVDRGLVPGRPSGHDRRIVNLELTDSRAPLAGRYADSDGRARGRAAGRPVAGPAGQPGGRAGRPAPGHPVRRTPGRSAGGLEPAAAA